MKQNEYINFSPKEKMQKLESILKDIKVFEDINSYTVICRAIYKYTKYPFDEGFSKIKEYDFYYEILFNVAFDKHIVACLKDKHLNILENFIYGKDERKIIFKERF